MSRFVLSSPPGKPAVHRHSMHISHDINTQSTILVALLFWSIKCTYAVIAKIYTVQNNSLHDQQPWLSLGHGIFGTLASLRCCPSSRTVSACTQHKIKGSMEIKTYVMSWSGTLISQVLQ
jgi:hypothetical protein